MLELKPGPSPTLEDALVEGEARDLARLWHSFHLLGGKKAVLLLTMILLYDADLVNFIRVIRLFRVDLLRLLEQLRPFCGDLRLIEDLFRFVELLDGILDL